MRSAHDVQLITGQTVTLPIDQLDPRIEASTPHCSVAYPQRACRVWLRATKKKARWRIAIRQGPYAGIGRRQSTRRFRSVAARRARIAERAACDGDEFPVLCVVPERQPDDAGVAATNLAAGGWRIHARVSSPAVRRKHMGPSSSRGAGQRIQRRHRYVSGSIPPAPATARSRVRRRVASVVAEVLRQNAGRVVHHGACHTRADDLQLLECLLRDSARRPAGMDDEQ